MLVDGVSERDRRCGLYDVQQLDRPIDTDRHDSWPRAHELRDQRPLEDFFGVDAVVGELCPDTPTPGCELVDP